MFDDPSTEITLLINIDGFVIVASTTAGEAVNLQFALKFAYQQQFGERNSGYGGDRTLFQAILQRAVSIRLSMTLS